MKLSSVKELIIQLMYAVYMQNYNVTVLFKEKKILYLYQRTNFKFQRNLGSTTKTPKHFCISFRQHHNCKQINCMICLLLLCCYGIEMYRSQVSYIEYSTARGFNQALVARYKQNLHRQINLDNQCILINTNQKFVKLILLGKISYQFSRQ